MPARPASPPSRRRAWRPVLALLLSVALPAAAQGTGAASAPPVRIRFSHVVAPDTPKGLMARHFQALVAQRSGGRLRVEVYPDSQLYGDHDEMEALKLGAVEMLAPSLSKFGPVGVPEFELFDLPFLFEDLAQVRRVTQGPVGQRLLARLQRQHLVGLAFMDNGFKHMSARRPLRTPADFRGLRLRVQASRVLVQQMHALGAQGVVLPFGETRRALQNGVVDGAENPLSNFFTQGLGQVQTDLTLTQHGYLGYAVVSHPRFWNNLAPSDQALLRQALAEAIAQGHRLAAEQDRQALALPGLRVHRLGAAERTALRQAVQPVYESFTRSVGPALLDEVRQALQAPTPE